MCMKTIIKIAIYIARKTFFKFLISKDTPALDDWYKEVLRILRLEKLTCTLMKLSWVLVRSGNQFWTQ